MSFKLGNTNISELYVGSTNIGYAYLGSTKVYEGSALIYNVTVNQSTGGTNMERFEDCAHNYLIETIPLFDTTALTDVTNAFYETYYVEGGQLALYQQMSSQANPPSSHSGCFNSCGSSSTAESQAETAQIGS